VHQDAQEFLGRIFDVLEKQTEKTEYKYLLSSVFGGKSCSQVSKVSSRDFSDPDTSSRRKINNCLKRYLIVNSK